jgi:putative salt-induced outer membrane protein
MAGMAAAFAGLVGGSLAWADEVYLANGDRLTGEVVEATDATVTLKTSAAGTVTIDRAEVARVSPPEALVSRLAAAPPPPEPEPADPWSGEIGAGYSLTTGNTESSQLDGRVAAVWKQAPHEVELKADAVYGSKDEKMNTQKYFQKAKYSRAFGEDARWTVFAQEEADHDRFADIHGRITPSAGVGYWWLRRERFKLQTELGGGFTHTDYRTSDTTTEAVLVPRLYAEALVGKVKLSEDWTLYPSLSEAGEYRWKSESVAEYPLSATLAARLSLINERNSAAPEGSEKSDTRLVSAIVQKF